jgi:hypothetical protein
MGLLLLDARQHVGHDVEPRRVHAEAVQDVCEDRDGLLTDGRHSIRFPARDFTGVVVLGALLRIGQNVVRLLNGLDGCVGLVVALVRSGWCFMAARRYAALISSGLAPCSTPSTS